MYICNIYIHTYTCAYTLCTRIQIPHTCKHTCKRAGNTWEPALNVCIRTLLSRLFQTNGSENPDPSKTGAGTDPSETSKSTSATHKLTPPSQTRVTEKLDPSNAGGDIDPSNAVELDPINARGVGQRCREAVGGGGEGGEVQHLKDLGHMKTLGYMKYLKMVEMLLEEVKLERKGGGGGTGSGGGGKGLLECDVDGCDVEGSTPLILVSSCAQCSISQGKSSQKFSMLMCC